jgi:hypothetical protein
MQKITTILGQSGNDKLIKFKFLLALKGSINSLMTNNRFGGLVICQEKIIADSEHPNYSFIQTERTIFVSLLIKSTARLGQIQH